MTKREASEARYVVGIDLGTTHCALAFADATADTSRTEVMPEESRRGPVESSP